MEKSMVGSIFGIDPLLLQQQQQAQDDNRGLQLAQLDPLQAAAASTYPIGAQMGRALGGLMGVQDPQMAENAKIMAVKQQARQMGLDPQSSEGLKGYAKLLAQAGLEDKAMQAGQKAMELAEHEVKTGKAQADLLREKQFRQALATLDPNDPEYQNKLMQVASQFGSPDKVMDIHTKSLDKQERLEFKREELKQKHEDRMDELKQKGADQKELQRERLAFEGRMQALNADLRRELAASKADGHSQRAVPVTIIDPDNPNQQITIDANTYDPKTKTGILGVSGRMSDMAKADAKAANLAPELQGKIASFDQALATLDRIEDHPGKSAGTGITGPLRTKIWGTDAYGFKRNLEAFKAQTFIPAVSALKGMGALSDAEGKKLTDAVGALDEGMSEAEFNKQINLIRTEMKDARERIVQRMQPKSKPSASGDSLPPGFVKDK